MYQSDLRGQIDTPPYRPPDMAGVGWMSGVLTGVINGLELWLALFIRWRSE